MIWLLLAFTLVLTCIGQLLQKYLAVNSHHPQRGWGVVAVVACLGLGALCWLLVLQRAPVSAVYPMLSLNYVLVMLASRYWFNETVSTRQWLGVACIIVGVSMLGSYA